MVANKAQEKTKMMELDDNILQNYDFRKRLGKGAYGIVWKAIDRRNNAIVAIKKIFDAFRDETDAQRTFREIVFLKAFRNHPNIVSLEDVHRATNNLDIYLIFEYMESDLHNVIKKGTVLKDVHFRYIMYQLVNAVKYIHSGNVIHRDLKPSNILVDSRCRVKLADFGLARSVSRSNQDHNDMRSDIAAEQMLTDYVATRWYRAPEILVSSKSYTKGIDMWSIGCILAEMLRGKPLFQGSSTINQIEKIVTALPEPTDHDIAAIGGGFGTALLNNDIKKSRCNALGILLQGSPADAIDLVKKLLIFDPLARLTATETLCHSYVKQFRNTSSEMDLGVDILPPFRDDMRLTVPEYRAKLYEMVQTSEKEKKKSSQAKINAEKLKDAKKNKLNSIYDRTRKMHKRAQDHSKLRLHDIGNGDAQLEKTVTVHSMSVEMPSNRQQSNKSTLQKFFDKSVKGKLADSPVSKHRSYSKLGASSQQQTLASTATEILSKSRSNTTTQKAALPEQKSHCMLPQRNRVRDMAATPTNKPVIIASEVQAIKTKLYASHQSLDHGYRSLSNSSLVNGGLQQQSLQQQQQQQQKKLPSPGSLHKSSIPSINEQSSVKNEEAGCRYLSKMWKKMPPSRSTPAVSQNKHVQSPSEVRKTKSETVNVDDCGCMGQRITKLEKILDNYKTEIEVYRQMKELNLLSTQQVEKEQQNVLRSKSSSRIGSDATAAAAGSTDELLHAKKSKSKSRYASNAASTDVLYTDAHGGIVNFDNHFEPVLSNSLSFYNQQQIDINPYQAQYRAQRVPANASRY